MFPSTYGPQFGSATSTESSLHVLTGVDGLHFSLLVKHSHRVEHLTCHSEVVSSYISPLTLANGYSS